MFVFIISWAGHHENASRITEQVLKTTNQVAVVYSDQNQEFIPNVSCKLIRRSNELFWEDKFKACLDATCDDGMLVIHADCNCENWAWLVKRCHDAVLNFKDIGVWAPKIDGTHWNLSVSAIIKINNTDLVLSTMTDGIVFYLSPQIIRRMKQVNYGNNKFGWGIDGLFCANSFVNNKLVVIDSAVNVYHPSGKTCYDTRTASLLEREFLKQFSLSERLQYELLRTHVKYNHARIATSTSSKTS